MKSSGLNCVLALASLSACAAPPAQTSVPAVLAPEPLAHAALTRAVTQALEGTEVVVEETALTESSRLILEPARPRDASGRLLQGRETRAPESFQLLKQGADCVLLHERTGKEYVLEGAHCAPESEQRQ